jgi:death-on-curing protein
MRSPESRPTDQKLSLTPPVTAFESIIVFVLPSYRRIDAGSLEAALYGPQTGYYLDLIEEAAALWESLAQNHPLIDGNKRTAFAATYTFLAINGASITADAQAAYTFISRLYADDDFTWP